MAGWRTAGVCPTTITASMESQLRWNRIVEFRVGKGLLRLLRREQQQERDFRDYVVGQVLEVRPNFFFAVNARLVREGSIGDTNAHRDRVLAITITDVKNGSASRRFPAGAQACFGYSAQSFTAPRPGM